MLLNRLYCLLLGCLIAKQSTTAFIISSYSPSLLIQIQKTKHGTRTDGSELYNYQSSGKDGANTNQDSLSNAKSIGDVVQNLHGGKYQFSETQYLAGSSLIGQQFAESLYSSSSEGEHDEGIIGIDDDDDTELPKWAIRLQDPINNSQSQYKIHSYSMNVIHYIQLQFRMMKDRGKGFMHSSFQQILMMIVVYLKSHQQQVR